MLAKQLQKQKAIAMRKKGMTYGEILVSVPVAKSTLSLWLRSVSLAKAQKQRLTSKRYEAQKRGALARTSMRLSSTKDILTAAKGEVGPKLTQRERLLIGAALYWAEGSKQRVSSVSVGVIFGNTDVTMVKFFHGFLIDVLGVPHSEITFTLYLHESHRFRHLEIQRYWRSKLELPDLVFFGTYYKSHNPLTKRVGRDEKYYGLVRLRVRRSTTLQRRIFGLICGINEANWDIV